MAFFLFKSLIFVKKNINLHDIHLNTFDYEKNNIIIAIRNSISEFDGTSQKTNHHGDTV